MGRLTITNRGARAALSLSAMVVLLAVLFNNATIAVYSHSSGSSAADAKAKAAAHHHKLPPPSQSSSINPKKYGAVGDGKHDDQLAINAAVAAARAEGKTVSFPAGNYLHSSVIIANGVALLGAGQSSTTLTASNALTCAVELTGNNPSFSNFTIKGVKGQGGGGGAQQTAAIWVNAASNFLVNNDTVAGPAGVNGIVISKCNTGRISNNLIENVEAMGMFISDSANVQVMTNTVRNPGTYPLFVNAYNGSPLQNITFDNNVFQGGNTGIAINSVQSCSFTNNKSTNQALLLFSEGFSNAPSNGVLVSGNVFNGTTTYGISANGETELTSSNVTITNNTITNVLEVSDNSEEAHAIHVQQVQGVNVSHNTINTCGLHGIVSIGCKNVDIDSNHLSNIAGMAINVDDYFALKNSGSMNISNNQMSNCCTHPTLPWVLGVYGSETTSSPIFLYTSLSIVNNILSGSANQAKYYIECIVPSNDGVAGFTRTISGDSPGSTLLPNNIAP